MSRSNNRTNIKKKHISSMENKLQFRNCAHINNSHNFMTHLSQNSSIIEQNISAINNTDSNKKYTVQVLFHIVGPRNSFDPDRTKMRVDEIISSINTDFNNYGPNPNAQNNVKYKNIVNTVFSSNLTKQNIYLSDNFVSKIPVSPSNIYFDLTEIYYYPSRSKLNLSQFDDVGDIELEYQEIKKFIQQNRATAIYPSNYLNIWVIDTVGTSILGFSSFPWETSDSYNGVIVTRRSMFPEDYNETNYNLYKIFTHEIGHYFGLLHSFNNTGGNPGVILNATNNQTIIFDPTDKLANPRLFTDNQFNPLFMDFMDYTYDRFKAMFTVDQIRLMRFMINKYKSNLLLVNKPSIPVPIYNVRTQSFNLPQEPVNVQSVISSQPSRLFNPQTLPKTTSNISNISNISNVTNKIYNLPNSQTTNLYSNNVNKINYISNIDVDPNNYFSEYGYAHILYNGGYTINNRETYDSNQNVTESKCNCESHNDTTIEMPVKNNYCEVNEYDIISNDSDSNSNY